ncbi:MAG TPA: mechanosensitive ion channel domain-containing protein [Bacteroidales bacterium]|nr:mechanosensitive ion channel domain-containing protein [Bacteroidales bacterium]
MNHKLRFLFDIQQLLQQWGLNPQQANAVNIAFGILNVLILAWLADIITRKIIIVIISRVVARSKTVWDDILLEKKVFKMISHLAPALVLWYSVGHVLSQYPVIMTLTQKALSIYMIVVVLMAINAFLKGVNDIYQTLPASKGRSIKGYIQVVQIIFYSIAIISIVSIITGTPSGKLITGLGAAAAVLLLVFRDTILGLVAGIQLSAHDMLRIGDWITMSRYGADGNVIEITLNTVKVRNFDKTITTIPTYALVSDSFVNWRGTEEESARRFKKYLNIDMKTVEFCTPDMIQKLSGIKSIREFIDRQDKKSKKSDVINVLHDGEITNLTLFRKYIVGVLRNHSGLNHKLPMLVHQLQPSENGLPLEIIAFVKGTDSLAFEELQSDLFDHLLAVLPEFELGVFQRGKE